VEHLGVLRPAWVYRNDRQIKEVSYRQRDARETFYTVRIRRLPTPTEP
jgi:hypothetical protein